MVVLRILKCGYINNKVGNFMKEQTIDLRTIIIMALIMLAIAIISTVSRQHAIGTVTSPSSNTYTIPTTTTMQWSTDTCWGGWMIQ